MLRPPALDDLSHFFANVSRQVASIQSDVDVLKRVVGVSKWTEYGQALQLPSVMDGTPTGPRASQAGSQAPERGAALRDGPRRSVIVQTPSEVRELDVSTGPSAPQTPFGLPDSATEAAPDIPSDSDTNTQLPVLLQRHNTRGRPQSTGAAPSRKVTSAVKGPESTPRPPTPPSSASIAPTLAGATSAASDARAASSRQASPPASASVYISDTVNEGSRVGSPSGYSGVNATYSRPMTAASRAPSRPDSTFTQRSQPSPTNIIVTAGEEARVISLTQLVMELDEKLSSRMDGICDRVCEICGDEDVPGGLPELWKHLQAVNDQLQSQAAASKGDRDRLEHCEAQLCTMSEQAGRSFGDAQQALQRCVARTDDLEARIDTELEGVRTELTRTQTHIHDREAAVNERMLEQKEELAEVAERADKSARQMVQEAEERLQSRHTTAVAGLAAELRREAQAAQDEALGRIGDTAQQLQELQKRTAEEIDSLAVNATQAEMHMNVLAKRLAEEAAAIEHLQVEKLDAAAAVTHAHVEAAIATGLEGVREQADNTQQLLRGLEARCTELAAGKADKEDSLRLADHRAAMDRLYDYVDKTTKTLAAALEEHVAKLATKASVEAVEDTLGKRAQSLEEALLKGLKVVTDRAAEALQTKVSQQEFQAFAQRTSRALHDFQRALAALLPTACMSGTSARAHSSSPLPPANCLSCDQRVRSSGELAFLLNSGKLQPGTECRRRAESAVRPERVPEPPGLTASKPISAADPLGAQYNARLTPRPRKEGGPGGAQRSGGREADGGAAAQDLEARRPQAAPLS